MGKASARKRERKAESVATARKKAGSRGPLFIGAIVFVVALGAALAALAFLGKDSKETVAAPSGVERASGTLSGSHSEEHQEYEDFPPMGGSHSATAQNCGFYDEPVNTENAVHSLEHGAIWIVYPEDLDDSGRDQIRDLMGLAPKMLASPSGEVTGSTVYVVAWGQRLEAPSPTDPRVKQAIEYFRTESEAPEPNAPCSGTGEPS